MSMLSISDARRITEDLNNDKSIKRHVNKLRKQAVTPDLLREIELEEALARHAWHPELCDVIQALLMSYFRMLRKDDEAKAAELKKKEQEEREARGEAEKPEEIPKKKKEEAIKKSKTTPAQPENIFPLPGDVPSLRLVTNIPRSEGIKRKHMSTSLGEPMSKQMKKEEMETKENRTSEHKGKSVPKEVRKAEEKLKEPMNSAVIQSDPIKIILQKIEKLPGKLGPNEIEIFLNGVNADDLMTAEKSIGRNLKRLDRVWWFLLERDFNIARDGSFLEPRTKYTEERISEKSQNTTLSNCTNSVEEYLTF